MAAVSRARICAAVSNSVILVISPVAAGFNIARFKGMLHIF